MKVTPIGEPQIIMSNPYSRHNYFGWPTAVRLQNGRIAVGASGFRLQHVCPFGKAVLSFSDDDGKSYTAPAAVIDTTLDDRDAGLTTFGGNGLILTSFNNRLEFQKQNNVENEYCQKYLESISPEEEKRDLGSTFRISRDGGITYGPIFHSPVSSPHGPAELGDGTILWVGRRFQPDQSHVDGDSEDYIAACRLNPEDGSLEYLGRIAPAAAEGDKVFSSEPFALPLPDGSILCHIRVESCWDMPRTTFTTYQSRSMDGGRTWSVPYPVLEAKGGAPAHLMLHSSGLLISVCGVREEPYGICCAVSSDYGETWSTGHWIYKNHVSPDLGYPSTVELTDGSLLTVFYAHPQKDMPAVIMQQRWRLDAGSGTEKEGPKSRSGSPV